MYLNCGQKIFFLTLIITQKACWFRLAVRSDAFDGRFDVYSALSKRWLIFTGASKMGDERGADMKSNRKNSVKLWLMVNHL